MKRPLLTIWLFTAAVLCSAQQIHGQAPGSTRSVSNASELEPDDPRAQRASAIATLLIATDTAEAEKYLKTHAAPGSPAAKDVEKQVKDFHALLASKFSVDRVLAGPEDEVLVVLNGTTGLRGGRMGLRIQIERDAPHRIRDVQPLQARRERGDGE